MRYTWDDLAPRNIGDLKVVPELVVPGWPKHLSAPHSVDSQTAEGFRREFGPQIISEWIGNEPGEALAIVNKTVPHQLFDSMVISSSDRAVKTSIACLTHGERLEMLRMIHGFVQYISEPRVIKGHNLDRAAFLASANFNPDNKDREGLQPIPRIHFHLNPMPWDQIKGLPSRAVPLSDIKSVGLRRVLFDPISAVAVNVLNDVLGDLDGDLIRIPGWTPEQVISLGRPIGFHARLSRGWDTLLEPGFGDLLVEIHRRLDRTYRRLREAFLGTGDDFLVWARHRLYPPSVIKQRIRAMSGLSDRVRRDLCILAHVLRDIPSSVMTGLRMVPSRQLIMAIEGLAYAVSLYCDEFNDCSRPISGSGNVYLVYQVKLFSPVGGAGVVGLNGVHAVRLRRGCGPVSFTERDMRRRLAFQKGFAQYLGLPTAEAHVINHL